MHTFQGQGTRTKNARPTVLSVVSAFRPRQEERAKTEKQQRPSSGLPPLPSIFHKAAHKYTAGVGSPTHANDTLANKHHGVNQP